MAHFFCLSRVTGRLCALKPGAYIELPKAVFAFRFGNIFHGRISSPAAGKPECESTHTETAAQTPAVLGPWLSPPSEVLEPRRRLVPPRHPFPARTSARPGAGLELEARSLGPAPPPLRIPPSPHQPSGANGVGPPPPSPSPVHRRRNALRPPRRPPTGLPKARHCHGHGYGNSTVVSLIIQRFGRQLL